MSETRARVVLLRHGQSVWNAEGRFTGWADVGLTPNGVEEARVAARCLLDAELDFDVVHTSLLRRAILTAERVLDEMDRLWIDVHKTWRLNERHYGALQGQSKAACMEQHGADQVQGWRRSYRVRPPALSRDDSRHPRRDVRYRNMDPGLLPATECLADVLDRLLPYWRDSIIPDIQAGKRVLIVAHGNSLRALVKHLSAMSDEEICSLEIPTGIPLVYELDEDLRPLARYYLDSMQ